jgi:proteasome lid subunit RPN8/RPN11
MIVVESGALSEMKTHTLTTFPDECCGFLFGTEQIDGSRTITKIWEVNNSKTGDKRRRFEIAGKDYMLAEKFALENDLTLLGIYHSHPNHPAIPSEHDRVAALPYFSYIILSVTTADIDHIRSWRLNDSSQFEEENFSPAHLNQSI